MTEGSGETVDLQRVAFSMLLSGIVATPLAVVLALTGPMSTLGLLYAGAAYTCAFGLLLIAAGFWIQHDLARHAAAGAAPAFTNRGGMKNP